MRFQLKNGSGEMKLRYLVEDIDRHGNARLYFRRHGRKIRLRETIGTDEFLAEYRSAFDSAAAPAAPRKQAIDPQSFRWLTVQYYASPDFLRLNTATQAMRRRHLDQMAEEHGPKRFKVLLPRHIKRMRDAKAGTAENPTLHAANNWLKTIRGFFHWAVDADHMATNPARDVSKIKVSSEGHHTWTTSEILQFQMRHPANTKAGLAFALLYYLGVRRSDVVKLGRQMETDDGRGLRLVETKGRGQRLKITELSIVDDLRAVLAMHYNQHLTYLTTAYGASFSVAGFGNWFHDRCAEAGLPHCSAHGLRKAGATIAADNGATTEQLMSMYGWANPKQAHEYTRKANRKRLAAQAATLLTLDISAID